jgi:DNA-binding NarL/FixJ family response regulator
MNILVTDDHEALRKGLIKIIKTEKWVRKCDEAENGLEAIEKFKENFYDIVFMDISMKKMDGIEATRILKKLYPETRIIIFSVYDSVGQFLELLEFGINAYLSKASDSKAILETLNTVSKGHICFPPNLRAIWFQHIKNENSSKTYKQIIKLTSTEKKVLNLICEGLSTKRISIKLFTAEATINNHKQNIMKKFDIHNTTGLILYAIRNQIFIP